MLNINLLQSQLIWENPVENRKQFEQLFQGVDEVVDIIVLPEMFTTGFSMATEHAEDMQGETLAWMKIQAQKNDVVICGSIMAKENDNFYNRFLWVQPNGEVQHYDKRHLFGMDTGENAVFTAGKKKLIIDYKGWKICPMICYDLRFPVWLRNVEDYDLLLIVANWPIPRISHWQTLLRARAIENQVYVAAVNVIGEDGNGTKYSGHSSIIDPAGTIIIEQVNETFKDIYTIKKSKIEEVRRLLPFLRDRD